MKTRWYATVVLVVLAGLVVGCTNPTPLGPTITPSVTATNTVPPLPTNTSTPVFTVTPPPTETPTATPEPSWVLPLNDDGTFAFADLTKYPEITVDDYTSGRWQGFIRQSGLTHPFTAETVCPIPWRQVDLKQPYQPDISFSLDLRPVISCIKPGMDFSTFPVDPVAAAWFQSGDPYYQQFMILTMQIWNPDAPDGFVLVSVVTPMVLYEEGEDWAGNQNRYDGGCPTCYQGISLSRAGEREGIDEYVNTNLSEIGLYDEAEMYALIAQWDETEVPPLEMEYKFISGWNGFY